MNKPNLNPNPNPNMYIDQKNQTLLWEMLHRSPIIHTVFPPNDPVENKQKEEWFRTIISQFYQREPVIQSRDELTRINRDTLFKMMNELRSYVNKSQPQPQGSQQPQPQPFHGSQQPQPFQGSQQPFQGLQQGSPVAHAPYQPQATRSAPRETGYMNAFETRQKEYANMAKPLTAPDVNFTLSEDTKITNMDELVKMHRQMRELDVPIPNPTTNPNTTHINNTTTNPNTNSENIRLKIQEDMSPDVLDVIETIEIRGIDNQKKVSWSSEPPMSMDTLKSEISELREKIDRLTDSVNILLQSREQNREHSSDNTPSDIVHQTPE